MNEYESTWPDNPDQIESVVNAWAGAIGDSNRYSAKEIAHRVWECAPTTGRQLLIAKQLPQGKSAKRIAEIQSELRRREPVLHDGLVAIPGHIDSEGVLLMHQTEGPTLLDAALCSTTRGESVLPAFRDAGRVLRAITETDVTHMATPSPRTNGSFFEDFERRWTDIKWLMPREHRSASCFLSRFPLSWRNQRPHHLLPTDFQPKNILLSRNGIVTIDPDYMVGPPALAVASFLVTLDIDLRGPLLRRRRITEACKTSFLAGFGVRPRTSVTSMDLSFYVAWVLLDQLARSRYTRPRADYPARLWYATIMRSHLRTSSATSV